MRDSASALYSGQANDANCGQYETQLAEYVYAEIAGDTPMERFIPLKTHLDGCTDCTAEYEKLKEIAQLAYTTDIPTIDSPQFDLSFLNDAPQRSPFLDLFGPLVIDFSSLFAQHQSQYHSQSNGLANLPVSFGVRANDLSMQLKFAEEVHQLMFQRDEKCLNMTIDSQEIADQATHCALRIRLEMVIEKWPIPSNDIQVVLKNNEEIVGVQCTDSSGQVHFEPIDKSTLNHLVIELTADMLPENSPSISEC